MNNMADYQQNTFSDAPLPISGTGQPEKKPGNRKPAARLPQRIIAAFCPPAGGCD
ncbi:hypothetical protein [Neisseria musculi]|uniref:hypothetical protein n=1 Tax=Neisseria musculi TaxID=1815583 RepID=UPI001FE85A42|nr:hypothetical protein [Neisseria musculi]